MVTKIPAQRGGGGRDRRAPDNTAGASRHQPAAAESMAWGNEARVHDLLSEAKPSVLCG